MTFVDTWRRRKSAAFDLHQNSTARHVVEFDLWGRPVRVYANANLSVYSGQACNARCPFCVEELRPASRGGALEFQKTVEHDDAVYFSRLEETLRALRPLDPSVSVTGGEPSIDPRLPAFLRILQNHQARKRTITTNATGLLDVREGKLIIDWITATGVRHLNISRAHPDQEENARLMRLPNGLRLDQLRGVVQRARWGGTRVRLSCVLVRGAIDDLSGILHYLDFAGELGVDNVIFRQLMKTDPATHADNFVVKFSDGHRVALEALLDAISGDRRFLFQRQIVGYYYYVEVWRYGGIDVVFEEADLAHLEAMKRQEPEIIHELVFHPNATLASTWQPWDGVLGGSSEESVSNCLSVSSRPHRERRG
jgi:molybdenum cofactor biosynthesis enzyme MoaA